MDMHGRSASPSSLATPLSQLVFAVVLTELRVRDVAVIADAAARAGGPGSTS